MAGVEKRAQMEEDDDDPLDHMMATITDGVEDEDEDEDEGAASSDEDSSDSEGEIGEEELASYRARVESNPQQYEAHVQLIAALRSLDGKEDALRQAREKMASVFPLPEAEWLEWLDDEERQARDSPVAKIQILSLYEQAVQDYRSVALWERYARFAQDFYGDDHAAVRAVYEDALTAVGLHVSEGARVWHAYRQFELKQQQQQQQEGGSPDATTERVRKLFVRELGVPLVGMDDTLQAYLTWEAAHGGDPAHGRRAHESASARLQEYTPFEAQVDGPWSASNPDYTKLEAWKSYIQFEESKNEPARVQMIYERAIQRYCLVPDLWIAYLAYLERVLKGVHDVVLSVYRRAVRNYQWSSQLWADYIRALERASRTEQEATAVFEKSLQAGMSAADDFVHVFQTFVDFQRRHLPPPPEVKGTEQSDARGAPIRQTLQRAIDTLTTYFPSSEWINELRVYWGTLEGRVLGDADKAAVQWEEVMKVQGADADRWRQYADTLWDALGAAGIDRVRSVYKRAANCLTNSASANALFNAWLLFERIYGDLAGFDEARRRQTTKLTALLTREQQQYEQQQQQQQQRAAKGKPKGNKREAAAALPAKPAKKPRRDAGERKAPEAAGSQEGEAASKEEEEEKKNETQSETAMDVTTATDVAEAPAAKGRKTTKASPSSSSSSRSSAMTVETDGSSEEERTVRADGIPYSSEEADIRKEFEKCGVVADVRLVQDKEGKFKGLAYVVYSTAKEAQAAAEKKWMMGRRNLWITRAGGPKATRPGEAEKQRAYSDSRPVEAEKRTYSDALTLFVSNMAFEMTEDDIRELFGALGPVKTVRLIMNGRRSKGYAYVRFHTEEALVRALALNQTTVRGRIINVARSNPPKRAASGRTPPTTPPAPASTKPVTTLTPRVVKKPALAATSPAAPAAATASTTATTFSATSPSAGGDGVTPPTVGKSNAHFRALLAKGKSRT